MYTQNCTVDWSCKKNIAQKSPFSHKLQYKCFSGPLRGKMVECYHQACDSVRSPYDASFADLDFYLQTVQTLLNTMLEMSKSQCMNTNDLKIFYEENGNEVAASGGTFLGGSLLTLAEFIKRYMPW